MRPKRFDIDPANVDPDGLGDGNSSAGTTYTLDGALTSGGTFTSADGLAHRLDIIDAGTDDQSGATYTIIGTDADGRAQTEAVTGPAADATVESTKYFLTVTSITIASPAATSTADIGTVDEIATNTIPLDWYREFAPLVGFSVTGTISMDLQLTADNPFFLGNTNIAAAFQMADQEAMTWIDDDTLAAVTADGHSAISDWPVKAMRFISNSYTDTAEVQATLTVPFA